MSKRFSFREIMVLVWLVFAAVLLVVYYRQFGSVWQLGPLAWARNQPSLDIFYNSLLKLQDAGPGTAAQAARQALRGLAGAVIVLSAAQVTGVGTLRILRSLFPGLRFEDGIDRLLYRTVLGLGGIAYLSLALAAVGLYTPVMVRMLILACLTVGGFAFLLSWSSWPHKKTSRSFYLEPGARRWKLIIGLALGVALIGALAPEIEWDALWYHLWLPERWLEAGRPVDIVKEYISLYPLTWELGYGAALSFGGPIAAKLLHFSCLPLTALLVFQIVRRFFPGASPWLAAALLVTAPTVLWEATTAYNDLALALYLGLAIYAVLLYDREQETSWLVVAALCLGLSLAIKHLALIGLVILVPGLTLYLWRKGNDLKSWLGPALSFGLLAMLLPLPWYLRSFFASGNPVFPDLYNLFGAFPPERWSAVTERGVNGFKAGFGDPRTLLNLAALPWNATVHAARYGGSLGPLFLVLIPGLVFSWRGHRTAVFLFSFCCRLSGSVGLPFEQLSTPFSGSACTGAGRVSLGRFRQPVQFGRTPKPGAPRFWALW